MLGDGPVSLPPQAVQMQGVRAYDSLYMSREEERRQERARERERDRERELRRQKEAAPKQVRRNAVPEAVSCACPQLSLCRKLPAAEADL